MSISPLAYADSLRVGTVDFVSPDEIKVLLDIEAPDGVALNTGVPRPFPRVNGYVLVPSEEGYLVAQVEWITVERSQYPKRKGMQDFGLVDLPYPLRKMSLSPLGALSRHGHDNEGDVYRFKRGVESYPTVGDAVLLPTQKQLRAIVESGDNRQVKIGTSPLAANAEVRIDPDRLFGRHLAVLGNTGSGKSCSVAGLIRWSLEAAKEQRGGGQPNARFIILDPNGEYANTFRDIEKVRVYAVEVPNESGYEPLKVPLWFWNSAEFAAFTQASSKTQRPTLVQALRIVREGSFTDVIGESHEMRRYLRTLVSIVRVEKNAGNPWAGKGKTKGFRNCLQTWESGLIEVDSFSEIEKTALSHLRDEIDKLLKNRSGEWPEPFSRAEVDSLIRKISEAHLAFGGSDTDVLPVDADVPRPFTGEQLLKGVEVAAEQIKVAEYVDTMLMRIRTLLADSRLKTVSGASEDVTLQGWLTDYIGSDGASNGAVSIVDLSMVPAEVVHIVTAVVARMTLEALQRYRRINNGKILPTVLVMEEAHTFIKRYNDDAENQGSAAICCQVFEKIAREGRKFGLGLVLSSQRPSELSPTVLSQCNTYLLHRISNDRDQELVNKLVPDNLRGLLRDLPSLPSRHAVLLGWASELPVLVQINALPAHQRPRSDDPDFWAVWSGLDSTGECVDRPVNWQFIAEEWQQLRVDDDLNSSGDNDD